MGLLNPQDNQHQPGILGVEGYAQKPMEAAQVQPGEVRDTTAQNFLQGDIQGYMNPYTQNVVDTTMSELDRQRQIVQQQNQDAMVAAGAFGGSRHGILEAETNRNFFDVAGQQAAQLHDQAFRFGVDTMQRDMDRGLQASMANQTADVNIQTLNADLRQQAASANFDAATLARRDATLAFYDQKLTELQHVQGLEADRQRALLEEQREILVAGLQEQRDATLAYYDKQRDELLHAQGLARDTIQWERAEAEVAGKQAAGIMAQLIQSIGAINQADMRVGDKRDQINALIQTTASTISGVADQFNQPGLIEWAGRMIDSIDRAAEETASKPTERPEPPPGFQYHPITGLVPIGQNFG